MDERGSNPQAGRPLPRDKGHARKQRGEQESHSVFLELHLDLA
jgi:hypothetical protein